MDRVHPHVRRCCGAAIISTTLVHYQHGWPSSSITKLPDCTKTSQFWDQLGLFEWDYYRNLFPMLADRCIHLCMNRPSGFFACRVLDFYFLYLVIMTSGGYPMLVIADLLSVLKWHSLSIARSLVGVSSGDWTPPAHAPSVILFYRGLKNFTPHRRFVVPCSIVQSYCTRTYLRWAKLLDLHPDLNWPGRTCLT